jgi:hypothetical protein
MTDEQRARGVVVEFINRSVIGAGPHRPPQLTDGWNEGLINLLLAFARKVREEERRDILNEAQDDASDAVLDTFEDGQNACSEAVVEAIRALGDSDEQ